MTCRIGFRDLHMGDIGMLYEIYSDKEAMKYRGSKPMENVEDAILYVKNIKALKDQILTIRKGIELTSSKELIGSVMYRYDQKKNSECEIGYSIGREYWGQGLGKEIVRGMLIKLEANKEIRNIIAWSNRENIASIKILNKLGFQLVEQNGNEDKYHLTKKMNKLLESLEDNRRP